MLFNFQVAFIESYILSKDPLYCALASVVLKNPLQKSARVIYMATSETFDGDCFLW